MNFRQFTQHMITDHGFMLPMAGDSVAFEHEHYHHVKECIGEFGGSLPSDKEKSLVWLGGNRANWLDMSGESLAGLRLMDNSDNPSPVKVVFDKYNYPSVMNDCIGFPSY